MLPPREREEIKVFWFTTNTSSNKVKFFKENPKASIYFVDKRFFRGVSLVGDCGSSWKQLKQKERIWREGDTMYYPEGVTDPDYCVPMIYCGKRKILQQLQIQRILRYSREDCTMAQHVKVVSYDSEWPEIYEREKNFDFTDL